MKPIKAFSLAACCFCAFGTLCHAADIVAPNAYATTEGESNTLEPFSSGQFGLPPDAIWQQVFASSQFSGSPAYDITSIAFRADGGDGTNANGFTKTFSIQVTLSTTSASPSTLSTTFSNNFGPSPQVVYNGSLTFVNDAGGSPAPFAYIIDLTSADGTPYVYVPSAGNLLMEIDITGEDSGFVGALDFTTSSLTATDIEDSSNPNATSGQVVTGGLVTDFGVTPLATIPAPAPEPPMTGCVGLGLALLGLATRLRRKQAYLKF